MAIKHFLDIDEFSKDELVSFVNLAKLLKSGQTSLLKCLQVLLLIWL